MLIAIRIPVIRLLNLRRSLPTPRGALADMTYFSAARRPGLDRLD